MTVRRGARGDNWTVIARGPERPTRNVKLEWKRDAFDYYVDYVKQGYERVSVTTKEGIVLWEHREAGFE